MSSDTQLTVDIDKLISAWKNNLPQFLKRVEKITIIADTTEKNAMRLTIDTNYRNKYSFDFKIKYLDKREVKVEVIDVEKGNRSADEQLDEIQNLIKEYIQDIHICAQSLHSLTNT